MTGKFEILGLAGCKYEITIEKREGEGEEERMWDNSETVYCVDIVEKELLR